jgi:acyl-CoA thioesterase II
MGDLERDTRLSGADGRYTITLSEDWRIMGPNGGYMAAVALRAAGMEAAIRRPASISCHFISVPKFAAVDVEVRAFQKGRRAESFHVAMSQEGRPVLQAIVRTAADGAGVEHDFTRMPEVPPPAELKSFLDHWTGPVEDIPFWRNIDSRIVYPERVMADDQAFDPTVLEWYRFEPTATFEDPFADACRLVVLMDTFAWPAGANPHPRNTREYQGVNLDVVAWFCDAGQDAPWLLCDYESPLARAGLVAGHGRVWSEDGRLLAMGGAQILCLPGGQLRAKPRGSQG